MCRYTGAEENVAGSTAASRGRDSRQVGIAKMPPTLDFSYG